MVPVALEGFYKDEPETCRPVSASALHIKHEFTAKPRVSTRSSVAAQTAQSFCSKSPRKRPSNHLQLCVQALRGVHGNQESPSVGRSKVHGDAAATSTLENHDSQKSFSFWTEVVGT